MFLITYPCYNNLIVRYTSVNINIFRLYCECRSVYFYRCKFFIWFFILPHKIPILRYGNKIENLSSSYYTGTCLDFFQICYPLHFQQELLSQTEPIKKLWNEGIFGQLNSAFLNLTQPQPSNREGSCFMLRLRQSHYWNNLGYGRPNGSEENTVR